MSIISYFEEIVKYAQTRSLRIYLVLVNVLLVVFGIWFSNASLLPFRNFSDFAVFVVLGFLFAIYRPGWALLFFIGTIALENVNLAPEILGIALRPYQFFAVLTIGALVVRMIQKKSPVGFVKMNPADWAVSIFALAGFLSALFSVEKGASFKQSLVALSFVAIYFLVRTFIKDFSDIKKILPFFLSSSLVVLIYGIWQNVRFANGLASFEVMPGRPNATFTEADWYGMFLVFVIALAYAIIYYLNTARNKKQETNNLKSQSASAGWRMADNIQKFKLFENFEFGYWILFVSCFLFLVSLYVVLIITVARSAWLGAGIVTIGFLKQILFSASWKIKELEWRKTGYAFVGISVTFLLALGIVRVFNLTAFELGNRAQSTSSGLQEITISCSTELSSGSVISSVDELSRFGCAHIDLEEIASEKEKGRFVSTVLRPDPNVGVRGEIYRKSVAEIKSNPVFGIGWGSIGKMLGTDERPARNATPASNVLLSDADLHSVAGGGAPFNTSNIFLEVWLGAGLLGFVSLVFIFGYVLIKAGVSFYRSEEERTISVFVALGLFAILIPNLFNAGIFLGFLWVFLGVAVSLLNREK